MIYHKKCKNIVTVDISKYIEVNVMFGISKSGLRVSSGSVSIAPDIGKVTPIFVCKKCLEKNIPLSDLFFNCSFCGEEIPVNEGYKAASSGGLYCKKHAMTYYSEEKLISLSSLCNKIYFE